MTEKELIAARLAGASYEKLGRQAGISESAAWKLLRGKVPAGRGLGQVRPKDRSEAIVRSRSNAAKAPFHGQRTIARLGKDWRSRPYVGTHPGVKPETMEQYITRTGWDEKTLSFSNNAKLTIKVTMTDAQYLAQKEQEDLAIEAKWFAIPRKDRPPLSKFLK